jgi:hypothetical protein
MLRGVFASMGSSASSAQHDSDLILLDHNNEARARNQTKNTDRCYSADDGTLKESANTDSHISNTQPDIPAYIPAPEAKNCDEPSRDFYATGAGMHAGMYAEDQSDDPHPHQGFFTHGLTGKQTQGQALVAMALLLGSVALFLTYEFMDHLRQVELSITALVLGFMVFALAALVFVALLFKLIEKGEYAATGLGHETQLENCHRQLGSSKRTATILLWTFLPIIGFFQARKVVKEQQQQQQARSVELALRLRCLLQDLKHHHEDLGKKIETAIEFEPSSTPILNPRAAKKRTNLEVAAKKRINLEIMQKFRKSWKSHCKRFALESTESAPWSSDCLTTALAHLKKENVGEDACKRIGSHLHDQLHAYYAIKKVTLALESIDKACTLSNMKDAKESQEGAARALKDGRHVNIGDGTVPGLIKMLRRSYGDVSRNWVARQFVLMCYDGLSTVYSALVPWLSLGIFGCYIYLMVTEKTLPASTCKKEADFQPSVPFILIQGVSPWEGMGPLCGHLLLSIFRIMSVSCT